MYDNKYDNKSDGKHDFASQHHDTFKEAVCISTKRIYDACRDRQCLDDMVFIPLEGEEAIAEHATAVRLRRAEVLDVFIDAEPVNFENGYYSINLTIYFAVTLDAAMPAAAPPEELNGICIYETKTILFGGEGSAQTFSSMCRRDEESEQKRPGSNLPLVTVQIADPVMLEARIREINEPLFLRHNVPSSICRRYGRAFSCRTEDRVIEVALGIFMIIQLEREVQLLVPVYDFCLPEKICSGERESNPCDIFSRICFPTEAFAPRGVPDDDYAGCGCNKMI